MTHTSTPARLLLGASLLFGLQAMTGCGNNENSLSTFDEAALQLSQPAGGSFQLELPTSEGRPVEQAGIRVRSAGQADLTLTKIEWVGEKPSRVFMARDRTEDVDESACSSDVYYVASRVCIETGAPDVSQTKLAPGSEFEIQMHVAAYDIGESNTIDCPEPGEEVPAEFKDNYCGAIKISTNARNTNGLVSEGTATVYLLANASSGRVQFSPSTGITFQNVRPGYMAEREFSIINSGDNALTVENVQVSDFGQYITLQEIPTPYELDRNAQKTYKVQVNLPGDLTEDDLSLLSDISTAPKIIVESSAPGSPDKIALEFDTSSSTPPIPQADRTSISFAADGDTQDIVLTNPGDQPVSITGATFEPSSASSYYAFQFEGSAVSGPVVIKDFKEEDATRNKKTFGIRYTAPSDMTTSPLAIMTINYNYFVGEVAESGSLRVTLLGDRVSVAYADVAPLTFSFSTQETQLQERTAVIRNLGTAALDLGDTVEFMETGLGGFEEFQVTLVGATLPHSIPAGGLQEVKVTFKATDGSEDNVSANITSNTESAQPIRISLASFASAPAGTPLTVAPEFSGSATVGALALFSFGADVPKQLGNRAQWVMLKKPAASKLATKVAGPRIGIVPDVAGDYTLLVTTNDGIFDLQERVDFTVE